MKSIVNNEKSCFKCRTTYNLHKHHIFEGRNRQNSEKYGLWVYLCGKHHNLSNEGVHFCKEFDNELKKQGQEAFEREYQDLDFLSIFKRNYL